MYEALEFFAFTMPGVIAMMGHPALCFAVLCVYWLAHTAGATQAYKRFKARRSSKGHVEPRQGHDQRE